MKNCNKKDVYEVVDGVYFVDKEGNFKPDLRKRDSETFQGALLTPGATTALEEGKFYVDSAGNISRDRRGHK